MPAQRHPVLYDALPWRRSRLVLGVPAVVLVLLSGYFDSRDPKGALPNVVGLIGLVLLVALAYMALRARRTWVAVDDDGVHFRAPRRRLDILPDEVRTIRVATLRTLAGRSERYATRPLKPTWARRPAVAIRMTAGSDSLAYARERLSARLVVDDQFIVPLDDCEGFRGECAAVLDIDAPPDAAKRGSRNRKKAKR